MYTGEFPNPGEGRFFDAYDAGAYWCAETATGFGPDGQPVEGAWASLASLPMMRFRTDARGMAEVLAPAGTVELRARTDAGLYRGLLFMTLHFPDQVMTNFLTIHATDPKSGTAEFKASAVKVEPVAASPQSGVEATGRVPAAVNEPTA